MRTGTFENTLLSPCCWAALGFASDEMRGSETVLWNGTWTCSKCNKTFPQKEGVAFLSVLDADWITALKELIARRRRTKRFLANQLSTAEREQEQEKQDATATRMMTTRFKQALSQMTIGPGMCLLDVGAGLAATSAEFAKLGAEVVAAETEVSNLLYQSFELTDEVIASIVHNGLSLSAKNPARYPDYFARVAAPAHRLPFAAGTFDIVFCRSVLHHLHNLPEALTEMLRVLKPGGMLVACSEPIRSILDREEHYLVDTCDKIEGMNEQVPRLMDYLVPISRFTKGVITQAWCVAPRYETKQLFDRIPYNFRKHLWPGEKVRGWKQVKLFFFGAAINLYATRNAVPIKYPAPTTDLLRDFSAETLARIYTPTTMEESIGSFDEGTAAVGEGLRRMMAAATPPPAVFLPGLTSERELRSGWRRKTHREGTAFRFTHESAQASIAGPPGATQLEVCYLAPGATNGSVAGISAEVLINDSSAGTFNVSPGSSLSTVKFPLPQNAGSVIDVELVNHTLVHSSDEGRPAELGLGIKWFRAV